MKEEWQKQLLNAKRLLHRREKRLTNALKQNQEQLATALRWSENYHEALLLQAHLYLIQPKQREVVVSDWEKEGQSRKIVLNPAVPIHEQLKTRFKAVKKLEKAIPHLERRANELSLHLEEIRQQMAKLESTQRMEQWQEICSDFLPISKQSPSQKTTIKEVKRLPYRIFKSEAGIEIWVGRTASDNEKLSLKCSRGNDWWLHVSGAPGSHIVIRSEQPDEQTLKDALQLALDYSRLASHQEAEVIVTQCKFVSKGPSKSKPGTVSVSKHKQYRVTVDSVRLERLKKHSIK